MKKIFLYRIAAVLCMCLCSLLIKSENIACKVKCIAMSKCEMQQQNSMSETHETFSYNSDGLFIKI
jgi:hypothetical protein